MQAHVMAAKAAVDALCSSVAIELGPQGVTSNVIAPGAIEETEGIERLVSDEMRDKARRRAPLGRNGIVKEIADAAIYLFSDAGNYVNGAVLVVDGGQWRAPSLWGMDGDMQYPEVLFKKEPLRMAKTGRESKAKL